MTADLFLRLDRIERRLELLEQRLGPAPERPLAPPPLPAPVATTAAPPLPLATTPRSAAPGRRGGPTAGTDYESWFGFQVLGRVGIGAVLLAAAWFGQLGWTHVGPTGRVLAVYALSAALIAAGALLRTRVAPRYVGLLWGGGCAAGYLAGLLASMVYRLVDPTSALLLLVAAAAAGQFLARRLQEAILATVALAGAYAAPVLVGTPRAEPTLFFAYLLILHTWSAWMERRWSWQLPRLLAVVASIGLAIAWFVRQGVPSTWSLIAHSELMLLGLVAPELARLATGGTVQRLRWWSFCALASFVQFVATARTLDVGQLHAFPLAAGIAWLLAGAALAPSERLRPLATGPARLGSVLLVVGSVIAWEALGADDPGPWAGTPHAWPRLLSLLGASAVLVGARRWILVGDLGLCLAVLLGGLTATNHSGLSADSRAMTAVPVAIAAAAVATGRLALSRIVALGLGSLIAFAGLSRAESFAAADADWLSLAFAITAALATATTVLAAHRRDRPLLLAAVAVLMALGLRWAWTAFAGVDAADAAGALTPFWNLRFLTIGALLILLILARRRMPADDPLPGTILAAATLALAYLGGLVEIREAVRDWPPGWSSTAVSLWSMLFAAGLLVAGFVRRVVQLRWAGLVGFALITGKILVYDLHEVDLSLRVLITGALGLLLLAGAWAYSRRTRR